MELATRKLKCQACKAVRHLLSRKNNFLYRCSRRQNCSSNDRKTHFGYESVTEEEKEEKVYQVFHNVAESYDLMNDAMSVGIHRLWKDYFMQRLAPQPGTKLLDVAGGTGDIAFRFLKYTSYEQEQLQDVDDYTIDIPHDVTRGVYGDAGDTTSDSDSSDDAPDKEPAHVTVCDINHAMLDVGQRRAEENNYNHGITIGNAESLPVSDNTYDAYTIAFGIRNCTHIDKVISEAYRVLKPGGRFMCLEFSHVPNPILQRFYDDYSFQVIPVMGQVIAGDWKSYQYLVESIRQFPNQEKFCGMIRDAGFRFVKYENLLFGVAAIHSGYKL